MKRGGRGRRGFTHHGGGLLRGGAEEGGEGREERAAYQVHKHVGREAIGRPAPGHGHGGCGNRAAIWPRPRPSPAHPPHHLLLPLLLPLPLLLLTLAGRGRWLLTELPLPRRGTWLIRLREAEGTGGRDGVCKGAALRRLPAGGPLALPLGRGAFSIALTD